MRSFRFDSFRLRQSRLADRIAQIVHLKSDFNRANCEGGHVAMILLNVKRVYRNEQRTILRN